MLSEFGLFAVAVLLAVTQFEAKQRAKAKKEDEEEVYFSYRN
jgi:hypothetical protein